ncbi:MAG: UvrD-helicase domain-containing protein [Sphingomicrobium sp.]
MTDAVELARRAAATLHAHLVAEGCDPWDAYALTKAAARRNHFDVEETTAGGANLNNSRATIIPGEQLILHEDIGSPFEKACLVGHEVGHLVLGDAAVPDEPCDFDVGRSSEAVPMGFDRVADYSNKQRREIQMDLFARELILPRERAFQLHVRDEITASEIAGRLGAPFPIIAQQLLDALLLPWKGSSEDKRGRPLSLNPSQQEAAQHFGTPFLLEAGPGTGKTQTLTARVKELLRRDVDPKRILVLTFSNKAAGEMVERIARTNPDAAASMWMGTFHAFGLEIVRTYHEGLGLSENPRLLDRVEAAELLEDAFPGLDLKHYKNLYDPTQDIVDMLAAISRAKDEVAGPDRYADCARAMLEAAADGDARVTAEKAAEVASVYEVYERLKVHSKAVDFGDLVMLPVKLIESHQDIRTLLQGRYDHVLVDEFQDVNRASVRLLTALTGGGAELWAVGDARQSIYRFRGASSYNVSRFGREDFPGGERGHLERNYRSVQEIVAAFTKFGEGMAAAAGANALDADRGSCGHRPELQLVEKGSAQSAAVAEAIVAMRGQGTAWRDQAVLITGNDRLGKTARELERLDIPVLFLGSLFERPEIRDLLSLISLLVDRRAMGLVRTATMPGFEASLADVASMLDELREQSGAEPVDVGTSRFADSDTPGFAKLAVVLDGFNERSAPWGVLARILLDRIRLAATLAENDSVSERAKGIAIWQFMNFVSAQPAGRGFPIKRLLDRIRRLVRLSEDRDLRHMPAAAQDLDAVRLMTVHGAKGLEFKAVHLPGMNQGTLPRAAQKSRCPPPDGLIEGAHGDGNSALTEGHDQEQECLFFVALSRARDRLIAYAAEKTENGSRRNLSKFVEQLGDTIDRERVIPDLMPPTLPEDEPIQFDIEGHLRFPASQLGLYDSCPRRFLYTHVLRVGGRRITTSFMRMHEAVTLIVKQIVESGEHVEGDELRDAVQQACRDAGVEDGPRFGDYVTLSVNLLQYFHDSRRGMRPLDLADVIHELDGHEISFRPDDLLVDDDGVTHVRRVRTGHQRSRDLKDSAASALRLAASSHFQGAVIELIHLSDRTVTELPAGKGDGGRAKLVKVFQSIAHGDFPTDGSVRTCPGCPAFFICGKLPEGALKKKF